MAGTTLKRHSHYGMVESPTRDLVIQHNAVVTDLETLRAASRFRFQYMVEDLGAGADISARAFTIMEAAATIESVKAVHEANSAGIDGSNTMVLTLRNITEGVDVASVTVTADVTGNTASTLAITAGNADIAANDILGVVVTNGAAANPGKINFVVVGHYQTVDAAADMTAAAIGDASGTAVTA